MERGESKYGECTREGGVGQDVTSCFWNELVWFIFGLGGRGVTGERAVIDIAIVRTKEEEGIVRGRAGDGYKEVI